MHRPRSPVAAIGIPVDELTSIGRKAWQRWRDGSRPVLGTLLGLLSIAGTVTYGVPALRPGVVAVGAVRAALPWSVEWARLPVSAFLPTAGLPLPLAVAQLVVVVGLAEMLLGRWATLGVAAVGQVVSTVTARLLLGLTGLHAIGLSASQAHLLDTGPSAVTTAVGAWLLVRFRAHVCAGLLGAALVVADAIQNNLDGREHLVAFCCGALIGICRPGRLLTRVADTCRDWRIAVRRGASALPGAARSEYGPNRRSVSVRDPQRKGP